MLNLITICVLAFVGSSVHGQLINLGDAVCELVTNREICFGGTENEEVFSGQGCFLSKTCNAGVHAKLSAKEIDVVWTLSVTEDDYMTEIFFWVSQEADKPRRFAFRLYKTIGKFGVDYFGCTATYPESECEPLAGEKQIFRVIRKPTSLKGSMSVSFKSRVQYTDHDVPIDLFKPLFIGLTVRRKEAITDSSIVEYHVKSAMPQPLLKYYDANPTTTKATTTDAPKSDVGTTAAELPAQPAKQPSSSKNFVIIIVVAVIVVVLLIVAAIVCFVTLPPNHRPHQQRLPSRRRLS